MARLCSWGAVFVFVVSSRFLAQVQGQWCYYPGGEDKALQQYPCDPYAVTTMCCPLGWTCFSNNLCVVTDSTAVGHAFPLGTASRGTCTNPFWNDTTCGDFCLDATGSVNNGSLKSCDDGSWCCETSGDCDCATGEGTFSLPAGTAQTIIGVTGLESTSTDFATSSQSSSSASQTTLSSLTSTSRSVSSTSSSAKDTTTTTSSPPSTSITSTSHTSSPTPSHTSSNSASLASATSTGGPVSITHKTAFKVGIAIAAILIALIIISLAVYFLWWKKKNQNRPPMPPMSDAESDIYNPDPANTVAPVLKPNPDPYQFVEAVSPVNRGASRNSMLGGSGGNDRIGRANHPVVDPYRMPYDGT